MTSAILRKILRRQERTLRKIEALARKHDCDGIERIVAQFNASCVLHLLWAHSTKTQWTSALNDAFDYFLRSNVVAAYNISRIDDIVFVEVWAD